MPKAPSRTAMVPAPPPNATRDLPLQCTTFSIPPPVNAKNVSSNYLKLDSQSWVSRQPTTAIAPGTVPSRGRKRKRPDAQAAKTGEQEGSESEGEEGVVNPASRVLIIHPGSTNLRVGLASDLYPLSAPMVIARRDRLGAPPRTLPVEVEVNDGEATEEAAPEQDQLAEPAAITAEDEDEDAPKQKVDPMTSKIDVLRIDLRSIMRGMKLRPVTNGRGLAASYNETSKPTRVPEHNDMFGVDWTEPEESLEVLVGKRATHLPCFSPKTAEGPTQAHRPWQLFYPFRAGKLDIIPYLRHYGDSSARQAMLNDVRSIFETSISNPREDLSERNDAVAGQQHGLGIAKADYRAYSIILIVPDLFSASDVEDLVSLLLVDMGFGAITVQQEGVCATFGAGLSSACVVHLGGERIGISCVDEGLVVADSRLSLAYGGSDITTFLSHLLRAANMPYAEMNLERRLADRWLIDDLKQRLCTLDPTQLGLVISDFYVRLYKQPTIKYQVRTYDEVIIGPMCLFSPRVVDFRGKRSQASRLGLSASAAREDGEAKIGAGAGTSADVPVTGVMQACVRHLLPAPPVSVPEPVPAATPGLDAVMANPDGVTGTTAASRAPTPLHAVGSESARPSPAASVQPLAPAPSAVPTIDVAWESAKVPLDVGIWNSIVTAGNRSEERVNRFAGNIVCVGGTALVPGLAGAIEARLNTHLATWYAAQGKDPDSAPAASVIPPPRDMDPRLLAWKGMAVMTRLESASEMWIQAHDWSMLGWRALREKSLFL